MRPSLPDPSWIWCTTPWTARTTTTTRSSCSACCTQCLTTKVSHSACLPSGERTAAFLEEFPFWFWQTPTEPPYSLVRASQVIFCTLKPQDSVTQATRGRVAGGGEGDSSVDRPAQHDCVHTVVCSRPLGLQLT